MTSTSNAIIDYLGRGPTAIRPAKPNVAGDALALFETTDDGTVWFWDGAAWVPFTNSAYRLPMASSDVLGGVKIDGITTHIDPNGVLSVPGSGVSSFNTRKGDIALLAADVSGALGYAPYDGGANPNNFQTGTQVSATVGAYVPLTSMGAANGVASLDVNAKVVSSQLPAAATGTLFYVGGWNAATNQPPMASGGLVSGAQAAKGRFYVTTTAGTFASIDGTTTANAGDWMISNGATWERVIVTTTPYLLLTGGALSGVLTLAGGDAFGVVDARIPGVSYYWQDAASNIAGAIYNDGSLSWGTFTAKQATILAGTAVLSALTAASPTFSGTTNVAALTASGTITAPTIAANALTMPPTGSFALGSVSVSGDLWAAFDPRIVGYSYGWFDPAGNLGGAIANDGSLQWGFGTFASLTTNQLIAASANISNLTFSGALNVASIVMPSQTMGELDPRIQNISYAWLDGNAAIGAALATDGTMMMGLANVATKLTLGFDASGPNDALRKSYADGAYINSTGGTMVGALYLPLGSPTDPTQAANKAYVDSSAASGGGGGLAGLQSQRDFPYPPLRDPKRDYGAVGDGVADDSTAVMACANAAIAAGERCIAINDTFNTPHLDHPISQILLIGVGQLLNANVQMFVIPPFAPSAPCRITNTMTLRVHCPKAAAKIRAGTPVTVVVTGESTYTTTTSATVLPLFWARAQLAMKQANPGKAVTWINRAIGGQTWTNLDTVSGAAPNNPHWYYDDARAWLLYIQDLNPDIVVVGFSANDGAAFRIATMISVLNKMAAWSNPPEVILATSNPYAQQHSGQVNTALVWEAQQAAACMERTWAISKGLGLVDTGRAITIHAKGFDVDDIPLKRDYNVTGMTNGLRGNIALPFTWPTRCYGYQGTYYIIGGGWAAMGNELQFELGGWQYGSGLNPNGGCQLRFGRDPATGQLYYEVDTSLVSMGAGVDSIHVPKTNATGWINTTDGNMAFTVACSGSRLVLQSYPVGGTNLDQWTFSAIINVPRYNQPWQPRITCSAGSVPAGKLYFEHSGDDGWAQAASANPDQRMFFMPSMTEPECWGTGAVPDTGWSGGGVGHDSALKGYWAIQAAIESCDWSA